jgi:hypothetical protein
MKDHDKLINLIAVGLDSKLAEKIVSKGYTLSKLKSASKTDLSKNFESWEISPIIEATKRKPISSDTINRLVKESDWKCCICWDISKETPLVIHHIIEHSKTQDDSYKNLVLLCLDHHALAHSTWQISRHPLPPELLKHRKEEWIKAVANFKKGLRPPPGKESELPTAFNQSDKEALEHFRTFIDRPAMHQPFKMEGNMSDFLTAITDIIRALNTGILKTREGDEIGRTKPHSVLSNPNWRQKLDIITSRFEELRTRFEIAVRDGELILRPDGFYCFNNTNLPNEIDAMRESIILLFNKLLQEAGLQPIRCIGAAMRFGRW